MLSTFSTRAEWLSARRKGIGASEIAAIMGILPPSWGKTPLQIYLEKIGEAEPFEGNERTRWGQILEPVIAAEINKVRTAAGLPALALGSEQFIMAASEDDPRFFASPDMVELPDINDGAEIKCSGMRPEHYEGVEAGDLRDLAPWYWFQVQWTLMVTGAPKWSLAVLASAQKLFVWEVAPNPEDFHLMVNRARDFLVMVEARTPPVAVAGDVDRMTDTPPHPGSASLSPEIALEVEEYDLARAEEREATERKDAAKARIIQALQGIECARGYGYIVTYKSKTRAAFEVKATTYNRLTVKKEQ